MRSTRLSRLIMWAASITFVLGSPHAWSESAPSPVVAIIIDDMGHSYRNGADLVELPFPLTLSFLPNRRYTKELAHLAKEYDKEIMVHIPMENQRGFALGHGALTSDMTQTEVERSLTSSLASVPFAIGVNNHMGSLLTTRRDSMHWVMNTLQNKGYYFVDSRTHAGSVAAGTAQAYGIPSLSRDVFLDHEQKPSYIRDQFAKLIKIAKQKGTAVAIGHPHLSTVEFLRQNLHKLGKEGISIATVSALLRIRHPDSRLDLMVAKASPIEAKDPQ